MGRVTKNSTAKRAHSPDAEPGGDKHPRVDADGLVSVAAEQEEDGSDTEWAIVNAGAEKTATTTGDVPALGSGAEVSVQAAAPNLAVSGQGLSVLDGGKSDMPKTVEAAVDKPAPATVAATESGNVETPTKTQANLDAFGVVSVAADVDVPDEDKIHFKAHYPANAKKRFNGLLSYSSADESIYATRLEPFNLEWSNQNIKGSRLIVPGQVTPVQIWVLGELTWNGLLTIGQEWPARAKVGVAPLRSGDLVHARQLVKRYSKSKKDLDVNNIMAVSAHTDMASRVRGSASAEAKPFHKIFDGRQIMTPDKSDMDLLQPKDLMRGDVVLVEMSVGRYWDDSENGRIKDWASTRAFFHLEAVTLIVNGVDEGAAVGPTGGKGKKKLIVL